MAAAYRDALRTVADVSERQLVQSLKGENVDVFGFFESGRDVSLCVLVVRGGVVQDRREFFFEQSQEVDPAAFLEAFLPAVLRRQSRSCPRRSTCRCRSPGPELLEEFLQAKRGARLRVRVPRRGAAAERVALANTNAQQRHRIRFRRRRRAEDALGVERLARVLDLPVPPRPDRGLRHLASAGDRQRRVARRLRGRQAVEVRLPPLRHRRRRACSRRTTFAAWGRRSNGATGGCATRASRCPISSSWTAAAASCRPRSPRSTGSASPSRRRGWRSARRRSGCPTGRSRSGCRGRIRRSSSSRGCATRRTDSRSRGTAGAAPGGCARRA